MIRSLKKMKKVFIILLVMIVLFTVSALSENSEVIKSGDYEYVLLEDGSVEITRYRGLERDLSIPEKIEGNVVSRIGDRAFFSTFIESVTIPDSIISIGKNPFYGCSRLSEIKVSIDHPVLAVINNVLFNKSDKYLICYPTKKTNSTYEIPNGILIVGYGAFLDCDYLTSITIPKSVTSIGVGAFSHCDNLTDITIPDSVTSIGISAFSKCISLTHITIPDGVNTIEAAAFYECSNLTSITIPDSVTSIGEQAFSGCTNLASITIPGSVTNIENEAFSDCENLIVTVIRDSYAHKYCIDNGISYTYPDALDWLNN